MHLQTGTLLKRGDYRIDKVLGQGGFGITYLAEHTMLGRKVAIKEFFMKDECERNADNQITVPSQGKKELINRFREKFIKEARNIAKMNHPNIVRVTDVFEENGTAYYVMDYVENGSLTDKVKSMGYMPEPMAKTYILQIASALDYIHERKMNHLDVKPANIMLNVKDEAILIDFGLSKQYDTTSGGQTSSTPVGISEGYAPLEQYKQGGVSTFSPETDIYALGATFYKLLTGVTPPNATDVNEDGLPLGPLQAKGVSQSSINLIIKAMEPRKKARMNSVKQFCSYLKNGNAPESSIQSEETRVYVDAESTRPYSPAQSPSNPSVGKPSAVASSTGSNNSSDNGNKTMLWVILGIIAVGAFLLFLAYGNGYLAGNASDVYTDSLAWDTTYVADTTDSTMAEPVAMEEAAPATEETIEEAAPVIEERNNYGGALEEKSHRHYEDNEVEDDYYYYADSVAAY